MSDLLSRTSQPPRPSRYMRGRRVASALAIAAAMSLAGAVAPAQPAAAAPPECTPQFEAVGTSLFDAKYFYRRCAVPDFDQLRTFLLNGGENYCVPTSAMDWLAYVAQRGLPALRPGPHRPADYNAMTEDIQQLGRDMGTDPAKGTFMQDAVDGLEKWFGDSLGPRWRDYFTIDLTYEVTEREGFGTTRIFHPTGRDLAAAGASGSFVIGRVNWYKHDGSFYKRTGGHAVAVSSGRPATASEGNPGDYVLGFNDPSSDEGEPNDPNEQSPGTVDPHLTGAVPAGLETDPATTHYMDKVYGSGYSSGWLEGYMAITPKFGLFPDPRGDRMDLDWAIDLDGGPGHRTIDSIDNRVVDLALDPAGVNHRALLDDGRLMSIRQIDGITTELATYPNATNIVIDDQLRTALLDSDGRVTVLDRHGNPTWDVLVEGATGLAFSPRLQSLVTYDGPNRELVVLDEAIPGNPVEPRRLPLKPEGPPIAELSIDPTTGIIGLLAAGTNQLTRVALSEGRFTTVDEISLGSAGALEGLVADASGSWYSTRGGVVVAFDSNGAELPDNPFAGRPSARIFEVSQPLDIGEPGDNGEDVLPTEAPQIGTQLSLSQASPTSEVGDAHDVTVTMRDEAGAPLTGREVAYVATGANPTSGTVTTDGDGQATISWIGTAVGFDDLTAWEDVDDDGVHGENEAAASVHVTWTERTVIETSTSLTSSANPSRAGRPVTFTAAVSATDGGDPPTGTVRFTDNGAGLGRPITLDEHGRATLTTSGLRAGKHRIEATYVPPDGSRFTASSARLDQTVRCAPFDLVCVLFGILGLEA